MNEMLAIVWKNLKEKR